MEQTEKILEKIKLIKSDKIEEEIQDIITIDGAIIEDKSYRYKEKIFYDLENKYKKYLKELKYSTFKYEADDKVDKYVDSSMKEVNTQLGLLKLFLIRIAAIKVVSSNKKDELLTKIYNENDQDKINGLYDELDKLILTLL